MDLCSYSSLERMEDKNEKSFSDKQIVMGYSKDLEYKIGTYSINDSSLAID